MSISKKNAIQNISRLIPDDVLREQMIDLHLGKLSDDDINRLREEREREAEELLKLFKTELSMNIIENNGKTEIR